jgi:uncharacterized protein
MQSLQTLHLSPVSPIAETCRKHLSDHYQKHLKSVILYGSAARQELRPDSDIDLLVILQQPIDYCIELQTIVDLLYPLQLESSHWISAKPAEAEAFESGTIQLYRNVLKEGIVL